MPHGRVLRDLTDLLAHRGPDGAGWLERPGIALGHRRLSIVDPRHGDQPLLSRDGRTALVYNGEVYNHGELRERLRRRGHFFGSRCDTEVVLAAWREWGEACVERFDGMFALAVVELRERRVFLARDRLGVKPLFYAEQELPGGGARLLFASEPTPLLRTPGFAAGPDPLALSHYLSTLQVNLGARTLIDGVHVLLPGETATAAPGVPLRARRYWDVPVPAAGEELDPGETKACEGLRRELAASVRRRLQADVPVGSFLSGGVDSTVIAGLAAELAGAPLDAACVGWEEPAHSEIGFARLAAEGCARELVELRVGERDYFRELPRAVARRGLPLGTPNEVPMFLMAAAVRDRFGVALTGEGADELLAGYGPIHRSPFDLLRAHALEHDPRRFGPGERRAVEEALRGVWGVTRFAGPADHYLAPLLWVPMGEKRGLLGAEHLERCEGDLPLVQHYLELFERVRGADPYHQLLYAHLKVNLPGLLLRVDGATMGAGLEARAPFTDHHLVEWCMQLAFDYKLRWRDGSSESAAWTRPLPEIAAELDVTKYLLRRAFARDVPPEILSRPKCAFAVPIAEWLAGPWRSWARERVLDSPLLSSWLSRPGLEAACSRADERAGYRLWPLVNLALWTESAFGSSALAA